MTVAHRSTLVAMHEGQKLREIIERKGVDKKEFAAKAGIEAPSLSRYFNAEELAEERWGNVIKGFRAYGWTAELREIRPAATANRDKLEDLSPLLEGWSVEQLRTLQSILEASDEARGKLAFYIKGALSFAKK